jgi:hypothetical protein
MSLTHRLLAGTALALAGLTPAAAQAPTVSGLVQVWYSQMMDANLRANTPANYYNLRSEFRENGFSIRRFELKVNGKIVDNVEYETMIDPAINTSATNPTILQDAAIRVTLLPGLEVKMGQFKNLQTYEGLVSSSELLLVERSQMGRVFGDKRDRGAAVSCAFGDPKGFGAKLSVAAFNGMNDALAGKGPDTNAQKDLVARLDLNLGKEHKFGAYTLQGGTDVADKTGMAIAANPGGAWPSQAAVYGNKDKTTNLGAYYAFQNESIHVSAEYLTGLLGRRFPTLAASGAAVKREHLDQKFTSFYVTGGYTVGNHNFFARYDLANYNSGDQWYSVTNPYKQNPTTGALTGTDYSPKFTETTFGYLYAFRPDKFKAANLKVNYILRSKNFLKPLAPQTTEQGGDTLVVAFQVAF